MEGKQLRALFQRFNELFFSGRLESFSGGNPRQKTLPGIFLVLGNINRFHLRSSSWAAVSVIPQLHLKILTAVLLGNKGRGTPIILVSLPIRLRVFLSGSDSEHHQFTIDKEYTEFSWQKRQPYPRQRSARTRQQASTCQQTSGNFLTELPLSVPARRAGVPASRRSLWP